MSVLSEATPPYDLASARFFANPESTFGVMRERDPVYFHPGLSAWILTTYDDVSEALRNPQLSVDRNGEIGRGDGLDVSPRLRELNEIIRQWMVFSDPPRHTRLRSLVAKAFQPQTIRQLNATIERTVHDLLNQVEGRDTLDAMSDLGVPLAERITSHLLGLPSESPKQLKRWTENVFEFVGAGTASDALVHASADGIDACRNFIGSVIRTRERAPQDDLISQIVEDAGGDYTLEEIIGLVITLIVGAYETTAYTIANGLFALLRHPDQLERLRANSAMIESAVEEILRFEGPALSVQRRAKCDLVIRGTHVRERDRIYCMLHAANHDPVAFVAPATFDIARSPCRHVGLGLGPHFCLGAWLTRLETQHAILQTVQRFPNLRLARDSDPEWVANFAVRGLKRLALSTST